MESHRHARSHHTAGRYLRLLLASAGLIVPALASAVDCPADASYPDWPTTHHTPTGLAETIVAGACSPGGNVNWSINTTTYNTPAAFMGRAQALQPTYSAFSITRSATATAGGVLFCMKFTNPTTGAKFTVLKVTATVGTCTPPAPPDDDCDALAGKYQNGLTQGRGPTWASVFDNDEEYCEDGCKLVYEEDGGIGINEEAGPTWLWGAVAKWTGDSCGGGEPDPPEPVDDADARTDGEWCATSAEGNEYCYQDQDANCGYFNDEYVCLDGIGDDECHDFPSGGRICTVGAPTPPVPDDGTPGHPADPDDGIAHGNDTAHPQDVYDDTTEDGSSRDPGTGGTNTGGNVGPGGGSIDHGSGSGTGGDGDDDEGESASGGTTCASEPSCDGDPIQCAVLAQQWRTRCVETLEDDELIANFGDNGLNEDGEFDIAQDEVDLGSAFDSDGALGSPGCIEDYTVSMGGLFGSFDIPLSEMCSLLAFVGILVLVSAYVSAARIVIGGL